MPFPFPPQDTPLTPLTAEALESSCLKLRTASLLAISTPSLTHDPTPQQLTTTTSHHHVVLHRFHKLLHNSAYPRHSGGGGAFQHLSPMYHDIRAFVDQLQPSEDGDNNGFAHASHVVLLSEVYANMLVPMLECVIDYLRKVVRVREGERGTFEELGERIAIKFAKRCVIEERDRLVVRREMREMEVRAKLARRGVVEEGEGEHDGVEEQTVFRDSSELREGMEGPALAEVVLRGLRGGSSFGDDLEGEN